jgi:hypothetical protein
MTGNELMTDNEEYLIRQQFLKTFGGTAFKHLVEWFKSQKQGGKISISDFNLYPIIGSVKGYNHGVISDAGYYLEFNDYRANLLIYVNEREDDPLGRDFETSFNNVVDRINSINSEFNKKIDKANYIIDLKKLRGFEKVYDDWLPFKGIDTDMFTPVYEYQEDYNIKNQGKPIKGFYRESIIKNGILFKTDSQRIEFLKIIYEQLKIYLKFGENDYKKVSGGICLTTGREIEGEFYATYHKE